MALFASQLVTAASGSVGGLTFLRTHSGLALRARAPRVNRHSPHQHHIRALLAYVATYWVEELTEADRHGWELYARNTPRRNPLGKPLFLTGLAMWVRCQLPRLLAHVAFSKKAPTVFGDASFTPVSPFTVASVGQKLIFAFDNTDPWANELHGAMLIFIARPQNQSNNALNVSYQYADKIPGSPFVPPTSPANISLPFQCFIDQKVFFYVTVTRADSRYSNPQYATEVTT